VSVRSESDSEWSIDFILISRNSLVATTMQYKTSFFNWTLAAKKTLFTASVLRGGLKTMEMRRGRLDC